MALSVGTRLGSYEVVALIGAGGMGEVYRARDTSLGRDVALKVLPDSIAADPDRLMRFDREARLLASVSHPAIAHIYGVEPWQSSRAIVMELVPGPTLADRIAAGALTLEEALPLARQIAEALATAHDQGIVHRDLKPANIKASDAGVIKVLDFGLAKTLVEDPLTAAEASTVVSPAITARGVILGTAAYMSPEQARGKAVDKRTDIWAFGCVLFEMLTGVRAFAGDDVLETATAVLKQDPDWSRLSARTPAVVRTLLRRCLAKDKTKRLADLHDATLVIDDVIAGVDSPSEAPPPASRWPLILAWSVAAAAVAAAGLLWARGRTLDPVELSFDLVTPLATDSTMFALSPDGGRIVFMAYSEIEPFLWLRDLHSAGVAAPIAGTGGASFPFWSPDGESIGFFARGRLKRVDLRSGAVRDLAAASNPRGGTWSKDTPGTIVYALGLDQGIWRVASNESNAASQVLKVQPGQLELRHPRFLEDGRRFFYAAQSVRGNLSGPGASPGGLFLANLDGGSARLTDALSQTLELPGSQVMFLLRNELVVQSLDPREPKLVGEPLLAAADVQAGLLSGGAFSWRPGMLAYRRATPHTGQLQWFDRAGSPMAEVGVAGISGGSGGGIELSPDDRRVAVSRGGDVVTIDLQTGRENRLAQGSFKVWSSDGRAIFFLRGNIWRKSVDSDEPESIVLSREGGAYPLDADGRQLLFWFLTDQGAHDLWIHPLAGGADTPIARSAAREYQGQFRPDVEWVAYTSNQSGQPEIWMKRLEEKSSAKQVSSGGGLMPRWSGDGRELFFVSLDADLKSVPVTTQGNSVVFGAQKTLFRAPIDLELFQGTGVQAFYDVARDGRFLINVDRTQRPPITIVTNWKPPARR
jgi:hypothetical protein